MRTRSAVIGLTLFAAVAGCSGGNVFSLTVGTCFDDVTGDEVSDVPVVECSEPHDNEVYDLFDVEDGVFPGVDAIRETAQEGCIERFDAYVDFAYADSRYAVSSFYPTSGSWDQDDREVICFLYDVDLAKLTGSGSGAGE